MRHDLESKSHIWLERIDDPDDSNRHQGFERLLAPILQAQQAHAMLPWKSIQFVEHELLSHRLKPSKRQQGRFWYAAGIAYREERHYLASFEALTFCCRMIEQDDADTLMAVQRQLREADMLRGNISQAIADTLHIIENIRQLAASLDFSFAAKIEPTPNRGMMQVS